MKYSCRFSLGSLLLTIGSIALLLGIARMAINTLDAEFKQVNPSDQRIADYIYEHGGKYRADKKQKWHIVSVWLGNTAVGDCEIDVILELEYLYFLDISNSLVTDASLDKIVSHNHLRFLRAKGSGISRQALRESLLKTGDRILLDE